MSAHATLEVKSVAGRSVVTGASAEPPFALLAPSASTSAWVYQSSLGGGFVRGDDVSLAVRVEPGATLFLSSQASSKVYRQADARFELSAQVDDAATLVWWPDPVCCFAGASLTQGLRFSLARGAKLLCVDAFSAGRVSRGERWAFDRMDLSVSIDVEGRPALRDGLLLDPKHGALAPRLGRFEAFATVVLVGFDVEHPAQSRWPWGTVIRFGAESVEALTRELRSTLATPLNAALGEDPFARKW